MSQLALGMSIVIFIVTLYKFYLEPKLLEIRQNLNSYFNKEKKENIIPSEYFNFMKFKQVSPIRELPKNPSFGNISNLGYNNYSLNTNFNDYNNNYNRISRINSLFTPTPNKRTGSLQAYRSNYYSKVGVNTNNNSNSNTNNNFSYYDKNTISKDDFCNDSKYNYVSNNKIGNYNNANFGQNNRVSNNLELTPGFKNLKTNRKVNNVNLNTPSHLLDLQGKIFQVNPISGNTALNDNINSYMNINNNNVKVLGGTNVNNYDKNLFGSKTYDYITNNNNNNNNSKNNVNNSFNTFHPNFSLNRNNNSNPYNNNNKYGNTHNMHNSHILHNANSYVSRYNVEVSDFKRK